MSKKYDTLVYVGRFQPVHEAHVSTIRRAAAMARQLIIILGSADQPRTYKNPFSVEERITLLRESVVQGLVNVEVHIEPVRDSLYNDTAWAARIQAVVASHSPRGQVGIIGHDKDESTGYLKFFPQWTFEDVGEIEPLSATDVRDLFFRHEHNMKFIQGVVPPRVFRFLEDFSQTEGFQQVIRERDFISRYRQQFGGLAYPPVFVTADSVVVCQGHVLLIQRRSEPGRGLWALPGGFLDANTDTSVRHAALRELREETGIRVPQAVLEGSIKSSGVFDAINRSPRGRTITHAFLIELRDEVLPRVKGGDDAAQARWRPIGELSPSDMFEDHYEIIMNLTGATS